MKNALFINTAVLETLRNLDEHCVTVVHAYNNTFFMQYNHRNPNTTRLVFQVRRLNNFSEFTFGALPQLVGNPCLMMLDPETGLWDLRYPDMMTAMLYDPLDESNDGTPRRRAHEFRDDAWCIKSMSDELDNPTNVICSYYRPISHDCKIQGPDAKIILACTDKFETAQRDFDTAYRMAENRWINKNHSGR